MAKKSHSLKQLEQLATENNYNFLSENTKNRITLYKYLTKEEYHKKIEQLQLCLKTIIIYENDTNGRKRKSSTHKALVYKLFTEKYGPLIKIKIKEKENDNL